MRIKSNLSGSSYWPVAVFFFLLLGAPAVRAVNLVQDFYLPMPEQQIYTANSAIVSGTGSTINSTFSILVTGDGTVIYYDQWEDGYETDLSKPTQPTTQIWGDGNDAHGIPPGFAHNPLGLPAGTVITLTNAVTLPRNPSQILWDARDHIAATKALVISRAAWPLPTGPVFAGAVSVLSTLDYGTNFISPVGQDLPANLMKYVGMFVMAKQNNTLVTIDPNGNGVGVTNIVLNQGESYLVNGGIKKGGRVTSSEPIQADLLIGHVGASYASDWFTLYPVAEWDNTYYTPVGSAASGSQPAYVYIFNPNTNALTINYNSKSGSGSFFVPASNGVFQFQMPISSGASFTSASGQNFFPICTVAANNSSDTAYNWGFTLVPKAALTTVADVGWAPGSADGTVDGSPVWVTTLANTTVYVDYHDDENGALIDPNGNKYDTNFSVTALQSLKIYDPSKNQTAMKVYTVDGTLLTAAWGEDPDVAAPGNPYIDAGTTVLPFPVPVVKKSVAIVTNVGPAGLSVGDTIQYTVQVDNAGLLPLGNTVVLDAPSTNLLYLTNSTTYNGSPIPDSATGTPFPLDAPGYTIPVILSRGTSTFTYLCLVTGGGVVSNSVNIAGTTLYAATSLVPAPTNGASVSLNFTDTNGVPVSLYSVGANVFVTMTNVVGNTSSNTVQTIPVTVVNLTHGDLQTITLAETGTNTGVFRNVAGLPTSASAGLAQQDGILNVTPGDVLSVSYTDPNYGDSASNTAAILIPALTKQLYLSINSTSYGSTNGVQALNRIDPVAYGHGPKSASADIGSAGSGSTGIVGLSNNGFTGLANGVSSSTMTNTFAVASANNQLMLVGIASRTTQASSVTFSNVNLTHVGYISANTGSGAVDLWSLTNPPAITANVIVTFSAATAIGACFGVTTFTNVNTSAPLGPIATATGTTGNPAVTVVSTNKGIVYDIVSVDSQTPSATPAAGQTNLFYYSSAASGTGWTSGGSSITNGINGNVTMSWSSGSHTWAAAGISINPAPATGGGSGPATNATTFVQTPAFASSFTMPSNNVVTITNFITITNGAIAAGAVPGVTATLQAGGASFLTLTNSTYFTNNSYLVWSGVLGSNVTVPSGQFISYTISNGLSGVAFHVNYDSTNTPSKIILPASTVININTLGVYDAPYPGGNLVTTPVAGATLYVRANVSDPFGNYDIKSLGINIVAPSPGANVSVNLAGTNYVATNSISATYEYAWQTGPTTGNYNLTATANEGTEGVTNSAGASISLIFLDLGTPSATVFTSGNNGSATNGFPANSSACVRVTALDSITNPAVIQTITATLTSSSGDTEILTLTETGTNTGVYTACINTSTNAGAPYDGTLNAPVGSIITASYNDPNNASYSSSATAAIQPLPGVPGVTISKTIVSPAGGQVGTGQPVTYNLQVVNTGSTLLTNVVVTDNFPSNQLSYLTASLAPTSTNLVGILTWTNIGAMSPGQSTNLSVTFVTVATGLATNSATANGGTAVNSSSVTLLVTHATLNVTKILLSPTNTPVAVGSNVVFRITIQNTGNTVIPTLPLEDYFSGAYFQFVSATIPPNGSGAGELIWTNLASPVALGTNATITNDITMTVVGQGNPANNTATADFAVDAFGNPVPASSGNIGIVTAAAGISGHVYNDVTQNGVFTNTDNGLSGVSLSLYTDPNGDGNPANGTLVQLVTSDANGFYNFLNLNLGHYVAVATPLPGYSSSVPANNRLAFNLTTLTTTNNNNFFEYIPAPSVYSTISGTVWYDANGNGTNDAGETNIYNVEVDLVQDVNSNGLADAGEPVVASVNTGTNGNYSFPDITPGHYVIHQVLPYGYYSTGDSQGTNNSQISFVSTNGIVSTNNNFFDRLSPIAVNDVSSAPRNLPVILYPLGNDISLNSDALTITNAATTNGLVVINAGSTNLTYTPASLGIATIAYTISDGHGGTSTAVITVSVTNIPPVAVNDTASTFVNVPVTINVLTNDSDANGDSLVITNATTTNGVVVINAGSTNITYKPATNFSGTVTLNYTISDGNGGTASAVVTVTVTPVADVAVGKAGPAGSVYGTNFNYTISVTNFGPSAAAAISVTDSLPAGLVFISSVPVTTTNASNQVIWTNLGSLLAGATTNLTMTVNPAASGTVSNTASVGSPTQDPNPTNNLTPPVVTLIGKGLPLVIWPMPTNIVYGTPLGPNQNNATSSVPGTEVYTPTNGTVLPAGTNQLSVVYTPNGHELCGDESDRAIGGDTSAVERDRE